MPLTAGKTCETRTEESPTVMNRVWFMLFPAFLKGCYFAGIRAIKFDGCLACDPRKPL